MPRAKLNPVILACIAIAETTNIVVGDGTAPEATRPYIVITAVSSPRYSGPPLTDSEADSADRIQFSFGGETREQADRIRDEVREALTATALDAEFVILSANRRVLNVILDIPRGVQRDDRGLPNPIFVAIDQYMIETTPFTP